jgi:methanogenic corrinoid protein MtbC1
MESLNQNFRHLLVNIPFCQGAPMRLFREILKRIVYETDASGKVITQRAAASSINLPVIAEKPTQQQMASLIQGFLKASDAEFVRRQLQTAICDIKALYTETHDGFSQAKGIRTRDQVKVTDMYAFSVAAEYCFEVLPAISDSTGYKVAIGVMSPARQDCGKNLIKLVWQGAGHEVIDLGANLKPQAWLNALKEHSFSALAVSCMKNECVSGLQTLLKALKETVLNLPVVIGGIAVNKVTAYEFSQQLAFPFITAST